MNEIKKKIKELIDLGSYGDFSNFDAHIKKQDELIEELTKLGRKNKTLLGRILKMGVADGHAVYVITRVNKNSVSTQWIDYCDGYSDWHLGRDKGNMAMHQAKALIEFEDIFQK